MVCRGSNACPGTSASSASTAAPSSLVPSPPATVHISEIFKDGENEVEWSVFWLRMSEACNVDIQTFNNSYSDLYDLVRYLMQCEGDQLNKPSVSVKREEFLSFLQFFPLQSLMDDIKWLNERRFFILGAHTRGVEEELKKRRQRAANDIIYYGGPDETPSGAYGGADPNGAYMYTVGDFLVRPSHSRKGHFAVTYLPQQASPRHLLISPSAEKTPVSCRKDFHFTPLCGHTFTSNLSSYNYSLKNYLETLCGDPTVNLFMRGCGAVVGDAVAKPSPSPSLQPASPPVPSNGQLQPGEGYPTPQRHESSHTGSSLSAANTERIQHSISFTSNGFMDSVDCGSSGLIRNDTSRSDVPETDERLSREVEILHNQPIGRGSFGQVFKAQDKMTRQYLAVKRIYGVAHDKVDKINREIGIMAKLSHPNIVQYHGSVFDKQTLCLDIYMELMFEALNNKISRVHEEVAALKAKGNSTEATVLLENVMRRTGCQIVSGLRYLHNNNVVHRDIKPANILVSETGDVKLSDFGTAKSYDNSGFTQDTEVPVGTFAFMAPEILFRSTSCGDTTTFESRKQTDIWSLGCTLLMLSTGKLPWCEVGNDVVHIIRYIDDDKKGERRPEIPNDLPAPLFTVLEKSLKRKPIERPTVNQLYEEPFFQNV